MLFCTRSSRSLLRFGSVRFFEHAVNSAGGERLRQRGAAKPRARGETGDIIFTE